MLAALDSVILPDHITTAFVEGNGGEILISGNGAAEGRFARAQREHLGGQESPKQDRQAARQHPFPGAGRR
jgi:hypothetical protein